MRHRNWILAAVLCAGVFFATAQAARAEPTMPAGPSELPVANTSALETTGLTESSGETIPTTTTVPTTYEWEAETDEFGVTIYPPRPSQGTAPPPTTTGTTTSTKKTARTEPPFQYNPAHPDDNYYGPTPYRPIPNWYDVVTDEYGNEVTKYAIETTTTEPETVETSQGDETSEEDAFTDVYESPVRQPIKWAVAAGAGAALLAAAVGGMFVMRKARKDGDDDDYIDIEPEE